MSTTTRETRLSAAQERLRIAEADCAHWDYDSDGPGGHQCCDELAAAQEALRKQRRLARKAKERQRRAPDSWGAAALAVGPL